MICQAICTYPDCNQHNVRVTFTVPNTGPIVRPPFLCSECNRLLLATDKVRFKRGFQQPNLIINGDFEVNQDGTKFTGKYTVDRFTPAKVVMGTSTSLLNKPDGFFTMLRKGTLPKNMKWAPTETAELRTEGGIMVAGYGSSLKNNH